MDYYMLKLSETVKNPIKPYSFDKSESLKGYKLEKFKDLPDLTVAHFDYNDWLEVTDILEEPTLMISDKVKSVIENYNSNMTFKGIQLYSENRENIMDSLFWITDFEVVDCMHNSTEIFPNKWLKKLVLDQEKIEDKHIFKVAGLLETRIMISLRLCESILRRKPMGISFEKVEVR